MHQFWYVPGGAGGGRTPSTQCGAAGTMLDSSLKNAHALCRWNTPVDSIGNFTCFSFPPHGEFGVSRGEVLAEVKGNSVGTDLALLVESSPAGRRATLPGALRITNHTGTDCRILDTDAPGVVSSRSPCTLGDSLGRHCRQKDLHMFLHQKHKPGGALQRSSMPVAMG
jgi:hypothetical protein